MNIQKIYYRMQQAFENKKSGKMKPIYKSKEEEQKWQEMWQSLKDEMKDEPTKRIEKLEKIVLEDLLKRIVVLEQEVCELQNPNEEDLINLDYDGSLDAEIDRTPIITNEELDQIQKSIRHEILSTDTTIKLIAEIRRLQQVVKVLENSNSIGSRETWSNHELMRELSSLQDRMHSYKQNPNEEDLNNLNYDSSLNEKWVECILDLAVNLHVAGLSGGDAKWNAAFTALRAAVEKLAEGKDPRK